MKIAIQGAGIAGPTLAHWLLRAGHEVVLIEQASRFRTGGYIIDFWGVGYTIAERMGILSDVKKLGYSVQEVRLVDARAQRVGGFSTNLFQRLTNGRFTSIPRGDLAAAIYRTIEGKVETLFGNSLVKIEERETGVLVSFEHGSRREFDLVMGADGLHSQVRALTFGPEHQFEKRIGYYVSAFEIAGYRPRDELVYVGFAQPGRQAARFALREDKTMILFVFASEHYSGPDPTNTCERKEILRQVFGKSGWECPRILQAMEGVENIYFDRVSQICMDRWSSGKVVLLGDAAACVSLLAGEGTGLAMTEAYILAGELASKGDDYREAFRSYEQKLRVFVEGKQKSAAQFAGAFAPKTNTGVWFRNQVSKLLSVPYIANFFVGSSIEDRLELPNYDL